jgi:hypothetical protein
MPTQPLPIYPDFTDKVRALSTHIAAPGVWHGATQETFISCIAGGVIRLWLYAVANGQGRDFLVQSTTVGQLDDIAGLKGITKAMVERGWAKCIEKPKAGILFPGLKQYRKEVKRKALGEMLDKAGAMSLAMFEQFWTRYTPKEGKSKGSKQAALKEWLKIPDMTQELAQEIMRGAEAEARGGWKIFNGYSCYALRYLAERLWEQAPPPRRAADGPTVFVNPLAFDDRGSVTVDTLSGTVTRQRADNRDPGPAPSIAGIIGMKGKHGPTHPDVPPAAPEQGG